MKIPLLVALLSISAAAAPRPASKRPARRAAPAKTAPVKAAPAKAQGAPAAAPAAPVQESLIDTALFGLGAAVASQDGALLVAAVRPGSRADAAGLKPGDRLLRAGAPVADPAELAAALRAWTPGTRLSLTVRRGLEVRAVETAAIEPAKPYARGDKDLSPQEKALSAGRERQSAADGKAVVAAVAPLAVTVRADQGLWLRFPKGLPAGLKPGDELVAEAATGLTVDAALDFLAVPPGSKLRARVLEASDDGQARQIRLAFYALDAAGGGTYPTLGAATAVSGDQRTARVSSGGTLVAAAPLPDAKRRAPEPVLDADARLRVRLLEPLVIDEPPSFWRSGPGLWVKTAEDSGRRLFEITHVVAFRSGEAAGLKVGERLDSIGGRSTEKMDFAEAIDRLYGPVGSDVEVSVLRGGKGVPLKLKRGTKWTAGKAAPLAPAYNAH